MKNVLSALPFLWKNIWHRFPFAPRIKRSFGGLIGFCLIGILITQSKDLTVVVEPNPDFPELPKVTTLYNGATLLAGGRLTLNDPGISQILFLKNEVTGTSYFTLIAIMIGSILIILMMPKAGSQNLFRKDISRHIQGLGVLIISHALIDLFVNIELSKYIEKLTGGQFTTPGHFPVLLYAEMYVGLVVIAIGTWYKRVIKLQQEQDLTI